MDKLEQFAAWKNIAVDAARAAGRDGAALLEEMTWKNEDDLFAFFDCFRPDGAGVEKAFAGVVGGDEIVQRLLKVYECTKGSFQSFGYFIVRRPARATPERLVDLTTRHLEKVRQIARSFGSERIKIELTRKGLIAGAAELASLLEALPQIEIRREAASGRTHPDNYAPESILYDMVGDWVMGLDATQSAALMMREAFYSIACDYYIADYLMWPLYRQSTDIEEPFAPYFDLWTHGARPVFERPGLVTVYATGDT